MVADIIRDSSLGQFINLISSGRYLPYLDQQPDFVVPRHFLLHADAKRPSSPSRNSPDSTTLSGDSEKQNHPRAVATSSNEVIYDSELNVSAGEGTEHLNDLDKPLPNPYIVTWYGNDDPDNPRNWSPGKSAFIAFSVSLLTFGMYIGSAIYTSSIPGLMREYNVSLTHATLGLTLYIMAYGIGSMFLAPLQELPIFGRNAVYIASLFLFIIFQLPIITATNIQTVLAFRFFTGFFASPALATGGASMADIYPLHKLPYVLSVWAFGAYAGPITGPVIGGFAAQAKGWRWPQYELIWIASFSFVFLSLLLPETYGPTILLRRARRLRRLTGNQQLRAQSEKDAERSSVAQVLSEALYRPFVLAMEPVLMFANVYLGFVYAVFYLWFEAFPVVFTDIYHFNLGVSSLPFLGFIVSTAVAYMAYYLYLKYHIEPRYIRAAAAGKEVPPEIRLEIGLMASIFIPTSVLIFGFASKESIHWIVPVIGVALYLPGIFMNFQSILMYISSAYPAYVAPVLAGNNLARSTIASVFPLFGHAFFTNLGLGPASAILAGISFGLMLVFAALIKWGHVLRRRSKYAYHSP